MGFLKLFLRREDPMKLQNFNKIFIIKNFYFLGKKIIYLLLCNKFILNELLKRSSRDNSIMFIKDLIELNVCDLDVELNFYICVEVYIIIVFRLINIYMIRVKIDVSQIGFYLKITL